MITATYSAEFNIQGCKLPGWICPDPVGPVIMRAVDRLEKIKGLRKQSGGGFGGQWATYYNSRKMVTYSEHWIDRADECFIRIRIEVRDRRGYAAR